MGFKQDSIRWTEITFEDKWQAMLVLIKIVLSFHITSFMSLFNSIEKFVHLVVLDCGLMLYYTK